MGIFQSDKKVRFAVVGLGYISQIAVLPAFSNASKNCQLTALVSGDREKLETLGKKYGVANLYTYDQYEECLQSGEIDAVFIALPNSMHAEYTIRAAEAGIHVLCEKPMAVTSQECERMIDACAENQVKLMIAYRLHFEEANLSAVEVVRSGQIGEPHLFSSIFAMQVRDHDIRTRRELGGGALYDIGVYCINAARYIYRAEPRRITALISNQPDERFKEVDGLTGALLEFGQGEVASFVASHGDSDVSSFQVVGTKGSLRMSPAFDFQGDLAYELTIDGKKSQRVFKRRDQFAPELIHFADCIVNNKEPEPSGREGLADVRIIEAIYQSAREGRAIDLPPYRKVERPDMKQEIKKRPPNSPELFKAAQPTGS